jgi:hypothetical protein
MAMEYQKVDNEYLNFNMRRDFGLTSWEDVDELFPANMPMRDDNPDLIDWAKLGWDYEKATSSHDLRGLDTVKSRILWPNPGKFVFNGTLCPICQNPFGPEGGWALGSCQCMYHPLCLMKIFLVRRFCALCKAPFHKRLYEVFGLTPYMPPSWEKNPENTPGEGYKSHWGEDLIWSWRMGTHSVFKTNVSSQFNWENDHEEIVRVCYKLVGNKSSDQGRRNFFYQTLNGYWDSENNRFQLGRHPDGLLWNLKGELVTDYGCNVSL